MMIRLAPRLIWMLAGGLALTVSAVAPASAAALNPPFDLPAPQGGGKSKACEAPPPPVTEFSADSIYEEGDATRSTIDPKAKERYDKAIAPLRDFSLQVSKLANRYLGSKGADTGAADCAIAWLAAWARGGALGAVLTRQAALSSTRILSAIGFAYIEVKGAKGASAKDEAAIEKWLADLGRKTIGVYGSEGNSNLGNHRYWGGLAVGAIAIATGDRQMLDWAMESYRIGVCQVDANGALPIELLRGKRARDYHIHAVAPLVMLAEIGERNGMDSYAECDGALGRLIKFVLTAIEDPKEIERLAGAQQIPLTEMGSRMAWVAIYRSRFPLPVAVELPDSFNATTLGGNLQTLYGG
jgi:poly(beta-D-mannuronate) lyase